MRKGTLRLFCALAETRSFTRTADLNYVTQSAITQMLHALERAAGQPLATRRPFKLTLAGHHFYQHAREILRLFARMEQALQAAGDAAAGAIELAACHSIGLHQLPPVLARFQRAHPRVEIRVRYGFIDRVHAQVQANEVDLGLVYYPADAGRFEGLFIALYFFKSSAIVANCSSAASKSSVISCPMISGAGRLVESSNASSFNQKMSRFTLSRLSNSS